MWVPRPRAHHDHGGSAVAEQAAGHEVGHRRVVTLDREAAQLDREQHGDTVGVAQQVVVHPRDPGRARHTAEPHERHALDVVPQPDARRHPSLERWDGQPGDGGGHDQVDVGGRESGIGKGLLHRA